MLKMIILASGRGSNFLAIADAIAAGKLSGSIEAVFSDKPEAAVLDHARERSLFCKAIDRQSFAHQDDYERALLEDIRKVGCDVLVLAGYMRIIGGDFLKGLGKPVVNIHPSLLPAFPGLHAQKQAIDYGVKVSGCTVHFVDDSLDGGPIIAQRVVPVNPDDDEDQLAERILSEEHKLYPAVLEAMAEGRVRCEGRRVWVEETLGGKA